MNFRIGVSLLIALVFLFLQRLEAQCYGNPQAESQVCAFTPVSHTAYTTCGNCTHNWSGSPIAGQGTPTATYVWTGNGDGHRYEYPTVSSFNPNANCSFYDVFQTTVGKQPTFPMPAIANGPWNGDTGKVWIYQRNRGSLYVAPYYVYTPSWSVSGGTLLSSHTVPFTANGFLDTLKIKWSGGSPMVLTETRATTHYGNYGYSFNCNWPFIQQSPSYPSLAIFHPPVCAGSPFNFYTFPFANSTYTWSVTNGAIISGQGTNSVQITMASNGTVSVQRDSAGTITNASSTVTPQIPVITLGPDQQICQGASTTLTANPGFSSYLWSTGATTQSILVTNPGQYRVTASVNGSCVAMDTLNVSLIPTIRPNLGPDINTCNFPVTLDAGPGYVAYAWNTGATTQVINPSASGMFRVTVTDGNGCQTSDTALVYNVQPTVSLPSTASYCFPGPYVLNPSTFNVTSYLWSTGATTSTIQVTGLGPQTIWVQGSNIYGCSASDTIVVTGNPLPNPNIGPDQTVCPGTPVVLDAGPGFYSYNWTNGPNSQTYTVTNPGTYVVRVYNSFMCTAMDTVVISHFPFTPVNLGPDINVCQASATLNAGGGYSSYQWSTGATTPSINVTSAGVYSVTVTGAGGCVATDDINVSFSNFSFTLGNNVTVCEPQTVTLNPQLAGIFNYNWSTGANSPTLTLTAPGTYNVILTASNTFGCVSSDTVVVTILPTLPSWLGSDTVMCADTSITLNAGPGFSSYAWSTGATSQSIVAASGGVYRVTATAPNGCVRLDTINVSGLIDCVFPGDVNYDGLADVMDVLALGTALGHSGSTRPNATTQWYGQKAWNWLGSLGLGANYKQGDTDGDGDILVDDTIAIQLNYGSTHTKTGTITGGPDQLRIVPLNNPVPAGDIARFGVYFEGLSGTNVDSVHGLAMKISWNSTGLANSGLKWVDYSNAWFAPGNNRMSFAKFGANSAEIAISRTVPTDTSGQGMVMILGFQTDSNLVGSNVAFSPTVNMVQSVGMSLFPHTLQPSVTAASVVGGLNISPAIVAHVRIWPVPANQVINVAVEGQMPRNVRLVNMLGQVVIDMPNAAGDREFVLNTSHLPAGGYSLQVTTEDGLITKNVVVGH
ncbi:MAG: T9SS type A sorting domain-containing protein [Bacteroidetes bacterium]|nr:T9SS type A sorting domain-containing protein [Bacteroidota bacterium]